MLCASLGITQDVRPDHAQYLAHWVAIMKSDSKAVFTAAAAAARAVDYLESLQPPQPAQAPTEMRGHTDPPQRPPPAPMASRRPAPEAD